MDSRVFSRNKGGKSLGYVDWLLTHQDAVPDNVATGFLDVDKIESCKDALLLRMCHRE